MNAAFNPFEFYQYMNQQQQQGFMGMMNQQQFVNQSGSGKFQQATRFAGDNIKPMMQAASGLVGVADTLFRGSGVINDTEGNQMGRTIDGRPIMSTQGYEASIEAIRQQSKGEVGRSLGQGAGQGAMAGAAIGTMFGGPVGTAIGAGAGAIVGGIGGLLGGKRRKRQMRDEIANREGLLNDSMLQLNQDNLHYFESDIARDINQFQLAQRARRLQ